MSNARIERSGIAAMTAWSKAWVGIPVGAGAKEAGIATLAAALLSLMCTSCVTGPDYRRPEVAAPAAYRSETSAAAAGALEVQRDWWRLFGDAELDALIEEALVANQDVQAAMARVLQARASAGATRSSLYPRVTAGASATRSRSGGAGESSGGAADTIDQIASVVSQTSGVLGQAIALAEGDLAGAMAGSGGIAREAETETVADRYQTPIDFSYEIDLWGRIRRSAEAAEAQCRGSEHDLEVVRQTLLTDLARAYFSVRSLDAQTVILARALTLYEEQAELTRMLCDAGLRDETDALQADVQLASTQAQMTDTRRQRANGEHAIAVLLGRAPTDFALSERSLSGAPPEIPVGVPSDLLRQRPDVAEAEENLIAACAEIGVAEAEFYPSVTLTGSAGFQGSGSGRLVDWANRTWSLGPSVSLPLFEGGRLRANLANAKARYDEAAAQYRKSVLIALRDVEDSLTDLRCRGEQAEAQARASEAARDYRGLAYVQYESGALDYLHVVDAEQSLLSNELGEVQTAEQRMASAVQLIKAIGGGWEVPSASGKGGGLSEATAMRQSAME